MGLIHIISSLHRCLIITILKCDILQFSLECGMTAMIRPICIQHSNLCHRRITTLFCRKMFLNELEILECHGQSQRIIQCL